MLEAFLDIKSKRFFPYCFAVVTPSPINGGWSSWSSWSRCSAHCDGGIQERHRECSDPVPNANGHHCIGNNFEWRMCNRHNCEGNVLLEYYKKLSLNLYSILLLTNVFKLLLTELVEVTELLKLSSSFELEQFQPHFDRVLSLIPILKAT